MNVQRTSMNYNGNNVSSRTRTTASRSVQRRDQASDDSKWQIQRENLTLMWRIVQGNNDALQELFERYSGYVFGICLRVLGDRGNAEEVMIDTFWELWRKPERYDPTRGTLVKYLVMMARSRAIDRSRTRMSAKKMAIDGMQLDEAMTPAQGSAGSNAASKPLPLESMILDEQRKKVTQLLSELNKGQREAIELCFFHGLSHQQAADLLKQPLGTVKTRIRQGLMRLRVALSMAYDEQGYDRMRRT